MGVGGGRLTYQYIIPDAVTPALAKLKRGLLPILCRRRVAQRPHQRRRPRASRRVPAHAATGRGCVVEDWVARAARACLFGLGPSWRWRAFAQRPEDPGHNPVHLPPLLDLRIDIIFAVVLVVLVRVFVRVLVLAVTFNIAAPVIAVADAATGGHVTRSTSSTPIHSVAVAAARWVYPGGFAAACAGSRAACVPRGWVGRRGGQQQRGLPQRWDRGPCRPALDEM